MHRNIVRRFFSTAAAASATNSAEASVRRGVQIGGVKGDGTTIRWYKQVQVMPLYAETDKSENFKFMNNNHTEQQKSGGFTLYMDGKRMRTANEKALLIPSERLAKALAVEWDSQDKHIKPTALPLTRMVTSALDLVAENRGTYIEKLVSMLSADAACCREFTRGELGEKQDQVFTPLFEWMEQKFGAKPITSSEFDKIEQPEKLLQGVREYLSSLDNYQLASLDQLTSSMKSVVLALALVNNKVTVQEAVAAARLEEDFQTGIWGVVEGGHDLDRADMAVKVASATLMWRLLPSSAVSRG